MQVQVIDGAGGAVTVLDIRSIVLSAPRRGSVNPLPPLRLLGDLHDEIDCTGLDAEMARNIRKGTVRSVLPYLLQDDYSRELVPQETSVATLENDYLLATVLLEFGGRLWSLQDKVGGRELLYNNDRIQFGNLGLRNAWFPGGVEWNLGTTGHTTLTCSPVHAASLEFLDGAPGLRIYEWERMRDLVYQLDFRLGPRSRRLVVDIKVTNPNAHAVPVYWWSNIALASSPGIRVVVPSRTVFEFTYAQRLHRVPVPGSGAADLTYPHAAWRSLTCGKVRSRSRISGSLSTERLQDRRTCPSSTTSGCMAQLPERSRVPLGRSLTRSRSGEASGPAGVLCGRIPRANAAPGRGPAASSRQPSTAPPSSSTTPTRAPSPFSNARWSASGNHRRWA